LGWSYSYNLQQKLKLTWAHHFDRKLGATKRGLGKRLSSQITRGKVYMGGVKRKKPMHKSDVTFAEETCSTSVKKISLNLIENNRERI
jgi:hypothetical protein